MNIDHTQVQELMVQAASDIILPRWQNLQHDEITQKAADDVVTVADHEAEVFLSENLQKLITGSKVVGEEAAYEKPGIMQSLDGATPVWVIDPIDGTGNFATGNDKFAIMVCLLQHGETLAAWIYDPVRKVMTSAQKGAGTFINGSRLTIQPEPDTPSASQLQGALLTRFLPDDLRPTAQAAGKHFKKIFMSRCGGWDYHAFVSGVMQFLFYYRTLIWDHAPGCLIAAEAGAIIRRLDGSAYHPTDNQSGLLIARNPIIWQQVQQRVTPGITAGALSVSE